MRRAAHIWPRHSTIEGLLARMLAVIHLLIHTTDAATLKVKVVVVVGGGGALELRQKTGRPGQRTSEPAAQNHKVCKPSRKLRK